MTNYYNTVPGEIWQDGEGCLLVATDNDGSDWFAFGASNLIQTTSPKMVHPLSKVIDLDGNVLVKKLNYPTF